MSSRIDNCRVLRLRSNFHKFNNYETTTNVTLANYIKIYWSWSYTSNLEFLTIFDVNKIVLIFLRLQILIYLEYCKHFSPCYWREHLVEWYTKKEISVYKWSAFRELSWYVRRVYFLTLLLRIIFWNPSEVNP